MKKLLLSLVAVAGLVYGAQAQTEKGNFMLGGNVGVNSTKADGAPKADFSFTVLPSVGYFISNNFAIGTGVGYEYNKTVSEKTQDGAFKVAPFGRYYVGLSDQFKFFGQLSVPLAFGELKATDANGDNSVKLGTTTKIGVEVAPGFAFFPTKKIGIELSVKGLSYENYTIKAEGTGAKLKTNSFGLNADTFAPRLGVQFYF